MKYYDNFCTQAILECKNYKEKRAELINVKIAGYNYTLPATVSEIDVETKGNNITIKIS